MGPVTTNPYLIAVINMSIVFGVLIVLGIMMHVVEMIDPTKKKPAAAKKVAAPAAAPKVAAAPVAAANNDEIIAVIAAAVAACGCSSEQIACIRRIPTPAWNVNARVEATGKGQQCF
jgi:glutaconyl-CoA/methylmalonyl-CoA decarboxylase subunit delta